MSLVLGCLAASAAHAGVVHFGQLSTFGSASELDLSGTFPYAVDVGGGGGQSITGQAFTTAGVAGVSISANAGADPWVNTPTLTGTDSTALRDLMNSIRYGSGQSMSVGLAVSAGQTYKLQLLFNESWWYNAGPAPPSGGTGSRRYFDIVIEGALAVDEFEIQGATGQDQQPQTRCAVFTHTFAAGDDTLNIVLARGSTSGDNNPLIQAFTLEEITEAADSLIPEPAGLGPAGLVLAAIRRRRRQE
jgi:MYXO-CTERM domain-containing protein